MFEPYLKRWELTIDGEPFSSRNACLVPVRHRDTPAILKISSEPEEQAGGAVMAWWRGGGAAPVLAHDSEALLMVRAQGSTSLTEMVKEGRDDEATRILCAAASRLHGPRSEPLPALAPLKQWFNALLSGASTHGRLFEHCARTADELLRLPRDITVLHGDIHHGNVLDFGPLGWLAIDPKGLHGERTFDYANLFCNPDAESALTPGIFARRIDQVADAANLERRRLLQWVLAWTGLSTAWILEDGGHPGSTLDVGRLAAAALGMID
ncbi:aminoglycoside phosphotransferase family protein [Caballeronia sp. LZ032]|nr:aminoglycoside phosphotransferase family protein [Caballeronia sp. LZ032]